MANLVQYIDYALAAEQTNTARMIAADLNTDIAGYRRLRYIMSMSESILVPGAADALLFDLGRVVIDFDIARTLAVWAGHGGRPASELVERFVRDEIFWRYETGKLNDDEFFPLLRTSLQIDLTDAQLIEGWNATFTGEVPGIEPLLHQAARHLPLYAFSNTNTAHVAHFTQHYAKAISHFREIFLSSSIGLRKPNRDAYEHVIAAMGVPAGRIVFFDDLAENIAGARACGLLAVHVTSPNDVAAALAALGLLENA